MTAALRSCRAHFIYGFAFTALCNVLVLAYPLYMINVYSRVIDSRSVETLTALFMGFLIAVAFRAVFEWIRSALMIRASVRIDRRLSDRVAAALFRARASGASNMTAQCLRDLDLYRDYVTGRLGMAFFDAPWGALFIGVLLIFDPLVGVVAIVAIAALLIIEVVKLSASKASLSTSSRSSLSSYVTLDLALRSAEAVVSMGFLKNFLQRWGHIHEEALSAEWDARSLGAKLDAISSAANIVFQGTIMAVAAYQVLQGNAPAAVIFAAVILFQFGTKPVHQAISAWMGYIPVREGLLRVEQIINAVEPLKQKMGLPRPAGVLTVKGVTYVPPGQDRPIVRGINFGIEAGRSVGIVGLVGSGKTTLARLIVGCIRPTIGHVRIDGNDVWDWTQSGTHKNVGYLPQNIGLLHATVAENIGRFGDFGDKDIIDAGREAGAHELIIRLPRGYDTIIGEGGHPLSGGQRQLIGLARAIVGWPSVVILDEPNSNLDGPGEEALISCLARLKEHESTIVMISHRPNLIRYLDKVVLLKEGEVVGFGETDEVYKRLGRPVVVKKQDVS